MKALLKALLKALFGTKNETRAAAVAPTSYEGYSAERLIANRYDGPEGW